MPWHRPHWRPEALRGAACLLLAGLVLAGCAVPPRPAPCTRLQWLGSTTMARDEPVNGSTIGGISGLDYDARRGDYVAISDDRSAHGPARWMRLRVEQVPAERRAGPNPWQAQVTEVHPLRDAEGRWLRPRHAAPAAQPVPDPEAIRLLPDGSLLWTEEGDLARGFGPSLVRADAEGRQRTRWFYPFEDESGTPGVRSNFGFEGLAVTADGRHAWLALEAPLRQDGPRASADTAGAPVRISLVDLSDGRMLRQIAYQPDAVPAASRGLLRRREVNGISEILSDGPSHLLVLERSYSPGHGFGARLYRIGLDTDDAPDTLALPSFARTPPQTAAKTLIADLSTLQRGRLDNMEAMSWGPPLPDGTRTLVFASDDNFNPSQANQVLITAYLPQERCAP
ncbi:esterase-like activity of phytase family protein [Delftia tsuruhatensis]|uniref:esterase-like activity of phytase family protein n=1 Tax=Delftia tsuruhatensis TaxID=180282 RepID=UPI001F162F95|nr:esterase-like activity of phytase family protein [Delftia tsuruhatensis]